MAAWPKDSPWRQGYILKRQCAKDLGFKHPKADNDNDDTVVVVISHDCDIAPPSEKEPIIEAILGLETHNVGGNFTYAKSPRTLHLNFTGGEQHILVELDARNKVRIPKESLAEREPANTVRLSAKELNVLQIWLASRYRRASFPDAFVMRFDRTGIEKEFRKIIDKAGKDLFGIYFDVDDGENYERADPDDCYSLSIYFVYSVEPDKQNAKIAAEAAKSAVEKVFNANCTRNGRPVNIELRECSAIADTEMTLFVANRLRRWHTDHMSLRDARNTPKD